MKKEGKIELNKEHGNDLLPPKKKITVVFYYCPKCLKQQQNIYCNKCINKNDDYITCIKKEIEVEV